MEPDPGSGLGGGPYSYSYSYPNPDSESIEKLTLTGLSKLADMTGRGAIGMAQLNKTTSSEAAEQKSIDRMEKWLFMTVGFTIIFKLIMVYVEFEKTIKTINSATYRKWPTGGFCTALCVSYPVLSGFFGFNSSALPSAAYISFQMDSNFINNSLVQTNPGSILDQMYEYAETNSNAGAEKIICSSWGSASQGNVSECTASCKQGTNVPGIVSSAFSMGLMSSFAHGSFMGHGAEGASKGAGMLGFALVGAAIGAATSAWGTSESNDAANAANPVCDTSGTS